MAVGTASDYAALQKEHLAKQAGVKKWEDIFLQPYETAAQQVQTQAAYDISGAFEQYKQSELSAMRNTQLGSGFKEQIASDLASQYSSAFSQIKQQEATQLEEIQTSYLQTLAQQEEALIEQGKQFANIEKALYDYMGITDTSLLEQAYGVDGGLGFFEMTEPGSYKITERGIDAFDKALNDYYNATEKNRGQLFTDYLAEQDPELLDWYKQNSGAVRELVAGISASDREYTEEEAARKEVLDLQYEYKPYISESKKDDLEYLKTVEGLVTEVSNLAENLGGGSAHLTEQTNIIDTTLDYVLGGNYGGVKTQDTITNTHTIYIRPYDFKTGKQNLTQEQIDMLMNNGFDLENTDTEYKILKFKGSARRLKQILLKLLRYKAQKGE